VRERRTPGRRSGRRRISINAEEREAANWRTIHSLKIACLRRRTGRAKGGGGGYSRLKSRREEWDLNKKKMIVVKEIRGRTI